MLLTIMAMVRATSYGDPAGIAPEGGARFSNPVIFADYSDPDVIRAGDEYFLVSSSFQRVPAIPILRSRDLVHWTIVGHVAEALPSPAFDTPLHNQGVWAPSIRYHAGVYFLYYGDPDRGIFVSTAPHPAGPWSIPALIQQARGWIDPCPFWDEDGKAYLVHAWAKSRAGFNSILTIRPMSTDGRKILGEGSTLFDGRKAHPTIEGPKMYARNGYYYVFAPAGGVKNGWQTVLRARHPLGPYEDRVVLAQGKTAVNGPHQGAWVESVDGRSWFLHFQDRGPFGRVVHLQPMSWVDDWPHIGTDPDGDGIGEPVSAGIGPMSTTPVEHLQTSDEFAAQILGPQWEWQANPRSEWSSVTASPGRLRLFGIPPPAGVSNLWGVPNILLQMFQGPGFTATTSLSLTATEPGQRAGLVVMGRSYAYAGIESTSKGYRLTYVVCADADAGGKERVEFSRPVTGPGGFLRVSVDTAARCTFSVSMDSLNFEPMGAPFLAREGDWVGARVGLFHTVPAGGRQNGWADVDWFRVVVAGKQAGRTGLLKSGPVRFTVARDGSGDFRTIQEAIDAVPPEYAGQAVITVKNGLYPEKLHIRRGRLTILGENRDSTRIVYAELRSAWRQRHGESDRGSAVVNLDSSVTDVVFANLTIYNNYGSLYGSHDHQFAIRGGGTRVILLDCNILADGGDTVSLWNRENGMYYHAGCTFEGWVDFVCPRGWCFVTDSRFFGHNLNASIWHDGSADSSQKFVLRNCRFDGVEGFALGRRHRDAQFYLVDCTFSPNMADRPIYRAASSTAPDRWGDRAYFAGCRREGAAYPWFADSLPPGAPSPQSITAAWTFGGRWDPESALPRLLPAEYLLRRSASSGTPSP